MSNAGEIFVAMDSDKEAKDFAATFLWSVWIITETVRAIEEVHPQLSADDIRNRADAMDAAFGDASVTGWEALEHVISLPDPDDCHVGSWVSKPI